MCIVVVNREKDNLILAFNREEKKGKRWMMPQKYWGNYIGVIGYLDCETKGSWLVYNHFGIICCILNREEDDKGGKLSRGQMVLEIINNAQSVENCLDNWRKIDVEKIKPFNLLVISKDKTYLCSNRDNESLNTKVTKEIIEPFFILNRSYPNDKAESRIAYNYNRLKELKNSKIDKWKKIMGEESYVTAQNEKTMSLISEEWETLSHTLIKLKYSDLVNISCITY